MKCAKCENRLGLKRRRQCLTCKKIYCKNCSIKVKKEGARFSKARYCQDCFNSRTSVSSDKIEDLPSPVLLTSTFVSSDDFIDQRNQVIIIQENPEVKYKIGHKLGEGGSAIVYKAKNRESGLEFAVKQILIQNDSQKSRVIDEIALSNLSLHKNIIPIIEAYEYNFSIWLVEELMVCSLKDLILNLDFPLSEALIIFMIQEVASAILVMHNNGRIHRDIKSENILISKNGEIKLADLGCAVQLVLENQMRHTIIGTADYMAPELALGKSYNEKIDIWSLGILVYFIVEGELPFGKETPMKVLSKIAFENSPVFRNPGKWSDELNEFLALCLQKDPESRPGIQELLFHRLFERLPKNTNETFLQFLQSYNGDENSDS